NDSHGHFANVEFLHQCWSGDAKYRAVEIVNHRANGQQAQYEKAHARTWRESRLQGHFSVSRFYISLMQPMSNQRSNLKINASTTISFPSNRNAVACARHPG